jgi:hypothetical protein
VHLQLSLLETPPPEGAAPVLAALDDEDRAAVVVTLARLIAVLVDARSKGPVAHDEEKAHE